MGHGLLRMCADGGKWHHLDLDHSCSPYDLDTARETKPLLKRTQPRHVDRLTETNRRRLCVPHYNEREVIKSMKLPNDGVTKCVNISKARWWKQTETKDPSLMLTHAEFCDLFPLMLKGFCLISPRDCSLTSPCPWEGWLFGGVGVLAGWLAGVTLALGQKACIAGLSCLQSRTGWVWVWVWVFLSGPAVFGAQWHFSLFTLPLSPTAH